MKGFMEVILCIKNSIKDFVDIVVEGADKEVNISDIVRVGAAGNSA